MPSYSDFVERLLLNPDLFRKLTPTEPLSWDLPGKIRDTSDAVLAGGVTITNARIFALVRGAIYYAADDLDSAHRVFQDEPGDLGSYWHGMVHRREGDFDNARYWFRRAGQLTSFSEMHEAACKHSATMAKQSTWDAYLFTVLCEQVKFGAVEMLGECVSLQRVEFEGMLDYCWRQSVG